jgi:hypothetical protein
MIIGPGRLDGASHLLESWAGPPVQHRGIAGQDLAVDRVHQRGVALSSQRLCALGDPLGFVQIGGEQRRERQRHAAAERMVDLGGQRQRVVATPSRRTVVA